MRMMTSFSVEELLLPRFVNWSTNFRRLPLVKMALFCLKQMNSVLFGFTLRAMTFMIHSRLCSRDSA